MAIFRKMERKRTQETVSQNKRERKTKQIQDILYVYVKYGNISKNKKGDEKAMGKVFQERVSQTEKQRKSKQLGKLYTFMKNVNILKKRKREGMGEIMCKMIEGRIRSKKNNGYICQNREIM